MQSGADEPASLEAKSKIPAAGGLYLGNFYRRAVTICMPARCRAGTQRQGNLRVLADKAASYEANFSKGLFGFINYIEAIKKGRVASAPVKLAVERATMSFVS